MKLWLTVAVYAAAIAVLFAYKDEIADLLGQHRPAPLLAFALALCLVLFPVLPYKVVIGALGYMYGPLLGFLVSWSAATLASLLMYTLVRSNFRKQGRTFLAKFERMDKIAALMEKHPFAAILAARLIPVLPQAIVNVYPAFLSIRLPTYAIASALGKVPSILLFSYLGGQLFANTRNALIVICVYALLLAASWLGYRLWARKT